MSNNNSQLIDQLTAMTSLLGTGQGSVDQGSLARYIQEFQPIGENGLATGYPALLDICLVLKSGLEMRLSSEEALLSSEIPVLQLLPQKFIQYIESPDSDKIKDEIIELLGHPVWGVSLTTEDTGLFRQLLDVVIDQTSSSTAGQIEIDDYPPGEITEPRISSVILESEHSISADIPSQIREYLEVMISELVSLTDQINKLFNSINNNPETNIDTFIQEINLSLEFYVEAVTGIEFHGLGRVVNCFRDNLAATNKLDGHTKPVFFSLMGQWPGKIIDYLKDPLKKENIESLVGFIREPDWIVSPDDKQLKEIYDLLNSLEFQEEQTLDKPQRQAATVEDVSLELQDDIAEDLLEAMLQELPGQVEQLAEAIEKLAKGGSQDDLLLAKRIAHTLKGAGNTVGIRGIATVTHHLEDVLLLLNKHDAIPSGHILAVLHNAADCLAVMSDNLLGHGGAPENAVEVLQEILDLETRIDNEGIEKLLSEDNASFIQKTKKTVPAETDIPANEISGARSSEESEQLPLVRVPVDFLDNLLRLAGEKIISTGRLQNNVKTVFDQVNEIEEYSEQLNILGKKVEEIIDIKDLTGHMIQKVVNSDYDSLELDYYSEIHTYSKQLVEASVDIQEIIKLLTRQLHNIEEILLEQHRINDETYDAIMLNRLVPASTQFMRMSRCVRQSAKLTGKPVELHTSGGDTLIDSEILNSLIEPLLHLLRNAVDHGIEPEQDRIRAGKTAEGIIHLSFDKDEYNIIIQCQDDGKGLDIESIKNKAIENGLIKEDEEMTDEVIQKFIFRPDFSTRKETTQISGRGIGLNAVYAAILELSGTINIQSEINKGCLFEIKVPHELLTMQVLLVKVGPVTIALSTRNIEQVFYNEDGTLVSEGNRKFYKYKDTQYPAKSLQEIMNISFERRTQSRMPPTAIIYDIGTSKVAVLVDLIVNCSSHVVKDLGQYVPKLPGVLGVSILGDGKLTPVMDIVELLRNPVTGNKYFRSQAFQTVELPIALVVDDSLSARRALAQFMEDAGFNVRTARDGLEAFDIIKVSKPDIVLTDLEMPRLNGLELTNHIRSELGLDELPIIMITSRSGDRHKQEACDAGVSIYLTKPYSEEQLLDAIHGIDQ